MVHSTRTYRPHSSSLNKATTEQYYGTILFLSLPYRMRQYGQGLEVKVKVKVNLTPIAPPSYLARHKPPWTNFHQKYSEGFLGHWLL